LRIFIIAIEDPLYTAPFVKHIIGKRTNEIVGLAIARGDRLTVGRKKSKLIYLFSLLLIMGIRPFYKSAIIILRFRLFRMLSQVFTIFSDRSLFAYAKQKGIKTFKISSPNDRCFLRELRKLNIDVIINQSQNIIKKELLAIPKLGVINRHNALLPRNRGRLSPFWALYKDEKQTGVSIHFVNERIDAGEIIVQEKFDISVKDTVYSIVKKCYEIAPIAMLKSLEKLENGVKDYISNNDLEATYNSIPRLKDAWKFRIRRILYL
jgi:methionyl-tRNA formyltransferase